MTVPTGLPGAVFQTDHGELRVYPAGLDLAGRAFLLDDADAERLALTIAPDLELVDPDLGLVDPDDTELVTIETLRDDVGDTARSLSSAILIATRQLQNPEEWTVEQLPGVASVVSDLLETLTDLQADLEELST